MSPKASIVDFQKWASKVDADYAEKTLQFTNNFRAYAAEMFGPRCEEFEPECCVCKMWKAYDDVRKIVD